MENSHLQKQVIAKPKSKQNKVIACFFFARQDQGGKGKEVP